MFCKIKNPGFNTKLFILLWLVVIILSFSKTVSAKNYARLYSIRFNNTSMLYGHSLFFHMPGEDGVLDTDDDKSVLINGGASYNSDKMNIDEFLNAYPWHGGNLGDADKKKIDFYIADGASTDECWGAHLVFGADLMDYDVDYAYENCDMTLVESTAYDTIKDDITDQGASWYTFDGGDILSPPSVATVGPGWDPNIYCKVLSAKKALPTGEADEDDNEWHAIFKVWVSSWMNPEACSWTFGGDSYDEQQGWVEDNDLTNAYASASTDAADTTIAWLHHQGAATNGSNSVSWFDLLKPKTIIQQDGGSSKHPYEGALENAANSPNSPEIWRQDMDGTVSISMDSEGNYNISREYDNPDNPFPSGAWTDGYPPPITSISGLVLDSQTSNSISLSWTDPDENVLYFVWRSTYDGGDYNAGISTQPHMSEGTGIYENITGTSPVSGPSYTDSGMDPGIYYYRISGIWDYDKSLQRYPYERKYSNQVEGRTGLVAPSDFIANAISSNTIQWNWQDNSGDEEGFALYSSSGNILISSTTLTANTTYWLQTTLSANTSSYISSIKSLNFIGESSEVTISTFPIFTLSRTPASLNVLSTDVLSLDLSWSSNNNPQWTRYGIASSTDNFAVNISTLITFNDNLNISSTTISNLLPATTYYFKVWAFNENGLQTGFSNIVSTKTNSPNFSVVINEIAWGGTAGTNGSYDEWIELYNNTNAAIDLTGWELFLGPNNADDPNVQLEPLVGTIGAYSYYLVERGTDDNNVSDILADTTGGWGSSGLLNTGEHLQLRNASAEVIDNIDCSAGWFAGSASPNYFSMERKNTNTSGNISSNWASNNGVTINGLDVDSNPLNGTPKAANSANTIDTIAPGNIQNLTAIAHSSLEGAIVLNWTAPGDDSYSGIASSYEIKVSSIANIDDETDYLAASDLSNFSSSPLISPLISASTQTMTITGLTDGASYYFAIKAIDNVSLKGGWSRTSINQNNFTIAFDSAPASPSALTGLTSNEQLTLSWAEPSPFPDDFNNYRIWCDSTSPHDWADKFIYDLSSSTSYITNIHAGTSYYFRVTAIDDAPTIIESSASNEIVVMLNIPIEPENFQGDIVSSTTINWSWSDMSSNESGFAIFSSSGAVIVSSSTLTQNTTFWIQDSLSPNTTSFAHHIKAINSFGSSPPADLSSYPIFSASNPPLSFKIDELSPTSINISWSANNNPATTKYGLSIAKDSSFTVDLSTEIDYSDNFTSTFTSISDLSSGTSYWLRLWSYNDNAVSSSFSNILSTQTVSAEIGIICWLKGGELAANEAKNCLDNYGYATVVSSYVPTRTVLDNYDFVFYFQGSGFSVPDAKGGEQFQDYMQNGKGKLFISGEDWMYDWYSVTDFKNYLHDDASRGDACTAGNVF